MRGVRRRYKEFCQLSKCVGSFGRNESEVVLGDLNARVGNEVIEAILGHHGVPGRNESGERSLEKCTENRRYRWVTVGSRKMICINTRG